MDSWQKRGDGNINTYI